MHIVLTSQKKVDDSEAHSEVLLFCGKELSDDDFQVLEDSLH